MLVRCCGCLTLWPIAHSVVCVYIYVYKHLLVHVCDMAQIDGEILKSSCPLSLKRSTAPDNLTHRRPHYCLGNLWGFICSIQRLFTAARPTSFNFTGPHECCLSVCPSAERKSSLVHFPQCPAFKLCRCLFFSTLAYNFAMCMVWLLNAIITTAHCLCSL